MKFKHAMVAVACLVLPVGLLLVMDPTRVSESVGLEQSPQLVRACARYEIAKLDLVRTNGGQVMGIGLLAVFVRSVHDRVARRRILSGMLAAVIVGLLVSLRGLMDANATGLIWAPVALQGLLVAVLLAGLYGQRGPTGKSAAS